MKSDEDWWVDGRHDNDAQICGKGVTTNGDGAINVMLFFQVWSIH